MSKNKIVIEDQFVQQLFNHAIFQKELNRLIRKGVPTPANQPQSVITLVDQVCDLMAQSYRQAVDRQSLNVYQTCLHLSKDIQSIKARLGVWEIAKGDNSFQRERNPDISIFSEVSAVCDHERKSTINTDEKQPQFRDSFMGSLISDTGIKDLREEIQEKLKSSSLNISADLAKIETGVMQRLKTLEVGVNKKIQNIFKTLSSVFQTINDMQRQHVDDTKTTNKNKLQQLFETKLLPTKDKDKSMDVTLSPNDVRQHPKRRSFLGFKY